MGSSCISKAYMSRASRGGQWVDINPLLHMLTCRALLFIQGLPQEVFQPVACPWTETIRLAQPAIADWGYDSMDRTLIVSLDHKGGVVPLYDCS